MRGKHSFEKRRIKKINARFVIIKNERSGEKRKQR